MIWLAGGVRLDSEIVFQKVCVLYVCMYIYLFICTHVCKTLYAKSSLYVRSRLSQWAVQALNSFKK